MHLTTCTGSHLTLQLGWKKKGSQNTATLRITHTTPIPEIYWNSLGLGHLSIADKILVPNGVHYRGVPLHSICNYTAGSIGAELIKLGS